MDLTILKGIITGLILSLPFGPVGIYCMELTVVEGRWKGYITALGMVTIDVVYSAVSLMFLSSVESYIKKYENYLTILIAIFLMIISLRKIINKIELKEINVDFKSMLQNYLTGVGFAIVNISSIFVISTLFTMMKVLDDGGLSKALQVLIGVGAGGGALWFTTTFIISHFRNLFGKEKLVKLIKVANIAIFILAVIFGGIAVKKIINSKSEMVTLTKIEVTKN
nr:lysine transporter LysE [uncultured Fusobacterium sp.]